MFQSNHKDAKMQMTSKYRLSEDFQTPFRMIRGTKITKQRTPSPPTFPYLLSISISLVTDLLASTIPSPPLDCLLILLPFDVFLDVLFDVVSSEVCKGECEEGEIGEPR